MIAFGIGVLVTAVLVLIVKFTVRRQRPEESGVIFIAVPTRTPPHQGTRHAHFCWIFSGSFWPPLVWDRAGDLGTFGSPGTCGYGRALLL